jgi:hypothetical protein
MAIGFFGTRTRRRSRFISQNGTMRFAFWQIEAGNSARLKRFQKQNPSNEMYDARHCGVKAVRRV